MSSRSSPSDLRQQHKRFKYSEGAFMGAEEDNHPAAAGAGAAAAGADVQHAQAPPPCPLLQHTGVLPMLLHHAAFTGDHRVICRLLCCSTETRALVLSHCTGAVTLVATAEVPHAWVLRYAHLLRCLTLDLQLLSPAARTHVQDSLARSLLQAQESNGGGGGGGGLRLCVFDSRHDRVSVNLLKRLPVASLTRLVFCDTPDARHQQQQQHWRFLALAGHNPPGANGKAARKASKKDGLLDLAQAVRRLSSLKELVVSTKDGYADFLLPQIAFLKHLTLVTLGPVLSPNKALATHLPKGLKVLQLAYRPSRHIRNPPALDLSKCKALCHLDLEGAPITHRDVLPAATTHLQVGSCSSIQPLLELQHLQSLAVTDVRLTRQQPPRRPAAAAAAAAAEGADVPKAPYAELSQLTGLTSLKLLTQQALPPDAVLPTRLQQLVLKELRDSVAQLTGLKRLTSLRVGTLEVSADALQPLTALTPHLSHIAWGVVTPSAKYLSEFVNLVQGAVPGPVQQQRMASEVEIPLSYNAYTSVPCFTQPCLDQWRAALPVAELSLRGANLSPHSLQLVAQLRHLTELKLQGSTGCVECGSGEGGAEQQDPFRDLSDPIRRWTQLQSLTWTGDVWRITVIPKALPPQPAAAAAAGGAAAGGAAAAAAAAAASPLPGQEQQQDQQQQGEQAGGAPAEPGFDIAAVARASARAAVEVAMAAAVAQNGGSLQLSVAQERDIAIAAAEAMFDDLALMIAEVERQAAAAAAAAGDDSDEAAAAAAEALRDSLEAEIVKAAAQGAAAGVARVSEPLQVLEHQLDMKKLERHPRWCAALAAAVGSLTQLTQLDLSGWLLGERVTALRPLTRLRSLNLSNTLQTDFSLLSLLPVLGLLTRLSVGGNLQLTRAPLATVELLLPHLAVLDVRGNTGIVTDPAFKEWRARRPALAVAGFDELAPSSE